MRGVNPQETDDLPEFLDDFKEYREFCMVWRSQLNKILQMASALLPLEALQAAERRLSSALATCSSPSAQIVVILILLPCITGAQSCRDHWNLSGTLHQLGVLWPAMHQFKALDCGIDLF